MTELKPCAIIEMFDLCHGLIQEAKGGAGDEAFVTSHLDDAENWLDKIKAAWNTRPTPPTEPAGDVAEMINQLRRLAAKQEGYGMSLHHGAARTASLNLYGDRAKAAIWLLQRADDIADALAAPSVQAAGDVEKVARPWSNFDGDLPDWDHPLRCVYESGIQYAVNLLAKVLKVEDYEVCDGTEEFDGDLGGTMFNIVLAAMPNDEHGDPMHPSEVRAAIAAMQPRSGEAVIPAEPASGAGDDAITAAARYARGVLASIHHRGSISWSGSDHGNFGEVSAALQRLTDVLHPDAPATPATEKADLATLMHTNPGSVVFEKVRPPATPATERAGEPVAWMYEHPDGRQVASNDVLVWLKKNGWAETSLYAYPPAAEVARLREALGRIGRAEPCHCARCTAMGEDARQALAASTGG